MMKKLLLIPLLLLSLSLGAATYYVKTGGNDGAAGTSDATAWLTVAKIQATAFSAGDSILFKRGDTFRGSINKDGESGSAGNYIYFGAYGTGAKPKILGAKDLSATAGWTNHSGNVWETAATLGTAQNDISNLVFNNEASCGIKVIALVNVDTQGDFFYSGVDDLVYMYSVDNPGTFYTHIEACGHYDISQGLVRWVNSSYIIVENLDVRYSSGAGIEFQECDNVLIEHNDLSWIGGEYLLNNGVDLYRLGNGISITLNSSNFIVRYNNISQCYDAGISPQAWGESAITISNISIYYNIIKNCWYSYEFGSVHLGWTFSNVNFYNNTCVGSGYSWSVNQRPDALYSCHFMAFSMVGTVTNCNTMNNIFSYSYQSCVRIGDNFTKNTFDYNLYDVAGIIVHLSGTGDYYTVATWYAAYGLDQHSVDDDPLFVSTTNLHLQEGSPAKDTGVQLGYAVDFDSTPIGYLPDIGAYEVEDIRILTIGGTAGTAGGKIRTVRK